MRAFLSIFLVIFVLGTPLLQADELTKMAQQELLALGYDVDNTEGEATTKTVVAISKFQAENNLEVTGSASPQLIGALRAASNPQTSTAAPAPAAAMTPQQQQADLLARQQACLQEKYAAAQERNKKKRGMMRILSAVSRTSSQFGSGSAASAIGQTASDVYSVNATAEDLHQAGKDLGLTDEEMEACRNPQ